MDTTTPNVTTKCIHIPSISSHTSSSSKHDNMKSTNENVGVPKKRAVTTTDKWMIIENQLEIIKHYQENTENDNSDAYSLILRQIQNKMNGYKSQDGIKKIYDLNDFVDMKYVLDMLIKCEMKCFYCEEQLYVIYDNVREPRQWTLDRMNNSIGHNKNNVEIACLSCNLKRRCIYHGRYLFTKQMKITKETG
jgi:hypothetical protein